MLKLLLIAGASVAVAGGSFFAGRTAGWDARDAQVQTEKFRAAADALAEMRAVQTAAYAQGRAYAETRAANATHTAARLQKVKDYVSYFDDSACQLSSGFVRLADDAPAAGGAAGSGGDGAASGLTHADLLSYIVTVQGQYRDVAGRLVAAQDFITTMTGAPSWAPPVAPEGER